MTRPARGLIVLVAGPDGAGKSTLARRLVHEIADEVPVVVHSHWRPELLPHPRALVRQGASFDPARPHARKPHGLLVSLGVLGYFWFDFLLGGWVRFQPIRRRGGVVVIERGWWDIAVDGSRYRLRVPPALVRALGRLLPRPDLALVLGGAPDVLASRKPELPAAEIARQNNVWLESSVGRQQIPLDGTEPEAAVLQRVLDVVRGELAVRRQAARGWVTLPGASRASASYPAFDEAAATPEPRWWLPRSPRRMARGALLLYHPVTPKGLLGWEAARWLAQSGGFRFRRRCADPPAELVQAIDTCLDGVLARTAVELGEPASFAAARCNQHGKFVVLALGQGGAPLALGKIALREEARVGLAREAAHLERLGRLLPPPLRAPTIIGHEDGILLLAPERWRPRLRPGRMPLEVARALGEFFRGGAQEGDPPLGPAHGDTTPWNLLRTDTGWLLIDWEHAMTAAPAFHDVFHFFVQPYSLMGRPSCDEIRAGLLGRGWVGGAIAAYADAAGIPLATAPAMLVRYLEASLDTSRGIVDGTAEGRPPLAARRRLLAEVRA